MKLKLLAGAALAAMVAATGASAQTAPVTGWYGALDFGYHWPDSVSAEGTTNTPAGQAYDWDFSADDDFAGFARLGYKFTPNLRVELEGGWRGGEIDSIRTSGNTVPVGLCTAGVIRTAANPTCGKPDGDLEAWTFMANGIFDIIPNGRFNPFIGAGVGVARVNIDTLGQFSTVPGAITTANPAIQNLTIDDEDTAFAYQGIAGFEFKASDRLSLDVTYRYLRTTDVDFNSFGSASLQPGRFSGKYKDQAVTVGLRFAFGSAPPPPPPPVETPPPPPVEPPYVAPPVVAPERPQAREFIVYFPFDQYVLTPEAQAVVQEAASYATSGSATQIVIVGHTDTSGSTSYNQRLSERRAKAVADAMVGLGVQQTVVQVDFRGESQPAVATGDGVKEPLNRRATVSINF